MNKQEIIIGNQEAIIKSINNIKEKLDNHDKKIDLLTEKDVVEVKSNKKAMKDGFSVSMQYAVYLVVVHQISDI